METFSDMVDELRSRLMSADNSTLFTDTRLKSLINTAYRWAGSYFPWFELQKAKQTTTIANHEYYDYPDNFVTGSIIKLTVDGDDYERADFLAYQKYKETYPDDDTKYFSQYGRQYFIFPTPTTDGLTIVIWGLAQVDKLVNDDDKTIFYNFNISGNEAIVKKALSIAVKTANPQLAIVEENEAKEILTTIWSDIKRRSMNDHQINKPFFDVPDFFGGLSSVENIGRF